LVVDPLPEPLDAGSEIVWDKSRAVCVW
jgi:hypothetical protein